MPDGETTNTAAGASTQGSGQTQAASTGATAQVADPSTPTAATQAAQPEPLHLTQGQLDDLIAARVQRAVRADRRKRGTPPPPVSAVPAEASDEETDDVSELRTQLDRLQSELAQERRAALVARVAAAHHLSPVLAARLQGTTEAELTADAVALAKLVSPPKAPATYAGAGTKPQDRAGAPASVPTPPSASPFARPGTVAWPD